MKIIAESAFNHNGSLKYLKQLAIESIKSGADFFTVQVMDVDDFCTKDYSKYELYKENTLKKREWIDFFKFCKKNNINIIPCVLEASSFNLCYNYGLRFLKLHATDITNEPFLNLINEKNDVRLLLETQCSTYQDIEFGMNIIGEKVEVIFHGYSNYPTEIEDLNLNAIFALKEDFPDVKVGIADHSPTVREIPLMVLSMGYSYIEKHITLTRNNRNFDWQVSLYPNEFAQMVHTIKHYELALGEKVKHPVKNELFYRNILFKKVVDDKTEDLKRADNGKDFLSYSFSNFSKQDIGVALIARLKSQRFPLKVLKKFAEKTIIEDLFYKLSKNVTCKKVVLATSSLEEDCPLANLFNSNEIFLGHPVSVLDRMLSFSRKENLGGIFRVTGDNPFTDSDLMNLMIDLFKENELDYVRVNNVPFGVSAELFSTSYLWRLYLNIENPLNSEYLSWFVLNDPNARKGCVNFMPKNSNTRFVNLSVDYKEDYERCLNLLKKINKEEFCRVNLADIISHLDFNDLVDSNRKIKLPQGKIINYNSYLNLIDNVEYEIRFDLNEENIFNW